MHADAKDSEAKEQKSRGLMLLTISLCLICFSICDEWYVMNGKAFARLWVTFLV